MFSLVGGGGDGRVKLPVSHTLDVSFYLWCLGKAKRLSLYFWVFETYDIVWLGGSSYEKVKNNCMAYYVSHDFIKMYLHFLCPPTKLNYMYLA